IVPKVSPLKFDRAPVICLAGKTGAGKSVVARYLSVFYGFEWVRTRDVIRQLLAEDLRKPPDKRMFNRDADPINLSERDLREFGAVVLNQFKQVPLRRKLTDSVRAHDSAVVVDSIRDVVDVDPTALKNRRVLTWFVHCEDSVIRRRLSSRTKFGETRIVDGSPVDHTAGVIRRAA